MKALKVTLLTSLIAFSACGPNYHKLTANQKKSERLMKKLTKANGCAFYLGREYKNQSVVWTYTMDSIFIYYLSDRKVLTMRSFLDKGNKMWVSKFEYENNLEIDMCRTVHGDYIRYGFKKEDSLIFDELTTNINCLLSKTEYRSVFLSELVGDLRKYDLKVEKKP